jgi:short subunit dehydrogenase-like uncharacterized protein
MSTEPASAGKPVVVYGASGYTGRLICEYLLLGVLRSVGLVMEPNLTVQH